MMPEFDVEVHRCPNLMLKYTLLGNIYKFFSQLQMVRLDDDDYYCDDSTKLIVNVRCTLSYIISAWKLLTALLYQYKEITLVKKLWILQNEARNNILSTWNLLNLEE